LELATWEDSWQEVGLEEVVERLLELLDVGEVQVEQEWRSLLSLRRRNPMKKLSTLILQFRD
jgi:hypothetical protein